MRGKTIAVLAALLSTMLPALAQAQQVGVRSVPAGWVNTYAAPHTSTVNVTSTALARSGHLQSGSDFLIDFGNLPNEYKPAVQAAADLWSLNFDSQVPVRVAVKYEKASAAGVLASATPGKYFNNFTGIPDNQLWYPSALANAIAGKDLDPGNPEITFTINSTFNSSFYLGTDGNCPTGQYDLETIVLHELTHGLGFLSSDDYDSLFKIGTIDQPTPFDAYAQLPDGERLMDLPSPSPDLATAMTSPLVWSGPTAVKVNGNAKPKLYTPATYEAGSSISHLAENQFPSDSPDQLMTPNLGSGDVIHTLGPVTLAMMADLRLKPAPGIVTGVPSAPRNVRALVADKSAIITFDPPANARSAQVQGYVVRVNGVGAPQIFISSPATISRLTNGAIYAFSVAAVNAIGSSVAVTTNQVTPQSGQTGLVVDPGADGKYVASVLFKGAPVLIYSDTNRGDLKMATFANRVWQRSIIDGNSATRGRTRNNVAGSISACVSKSGKNEVLNVFYSDLTDKDLRYASFDGKNWSYQIVDGNGTKVESFDEQNRVRTASDVSVGNACAWTPAGLQVFYRDESQGILLGAVQDRNDWRYEVVDGDRSTDGRTTGDVAFHLTATSVGAKVLLAYDAVSAITQSHLPTRGELRLATRISAYPEDWTYQSIDGPSSTTAVAGYDLSMIQVGSGTYMSWLASTGTSVPVVDQVRWQNVSSSSPMQFEAPTMYGVPSGPMLFDSRTILFGCAGRLCMLNKSSHAVSLVSTAKFDPAQRATLVTLAGFRYAVVGVGGKLELFKLT